MVAGHVQGVPDWWPLAGSVQRMAQSSLQWPAQEEVELGGQLRGSCGCPGKRRWWLRRGVDGRILETEVKDELNSRGC